MTELKMMTNTNVNKLNFQMLLTTKHIYKVDEMHVDNATSNQRSLLNFIIREFGVNFESFFQSILSFSHGIDFDRNVLAIKLALNFK